MTDKASGKSVTQNVNFTCCLCKAARAMRGTAASRKSTTDDSFHHPSVLSSGRGAVRRDRLVCDAQLAPRPLLSSSQAVGSAAAPR